MPVQRLDHYSIRTADLEASRRFYTDVMGLRPGYRPPFDFPGLWLYAGEEESGSPLVHIIGDDDATSAYLGGRGIAQGSNMGHFDHIAFFATGLADFRHRCEAQGVRYVERTVPALDLHQLFLRDPSGITIEMNYPADEAGR